MGSCLLWRACVTQMHQHLFTMLCGVERLACPHPDTLPHFAPLECSCGIPSNQNHVCSCTRRVNLPALSLHHSCTLRLTPSCVASVFPQPFLPPPLYPPLRSLHHPCTLRIILPLRPTPTSSPHPFCILCPLQDAMDSASARGAEEEAEVWRRRLYRYLAGVLELDASAAADYHELQVRVE